MLLLLHGDYNHMDSPNVVVTHLGQFCEMHMHRGPWETSRCKLKQLHQETNRVHVCVRTRGVTVGCGLGGLDGLGLAKEE